MTQTINIHEAKTHLSRLLERVHAGEEIILAKAGKPYARLIPMEKAPVQRCPGRLQGRVAAVFFEPLDEADLDLWDGR